MVEEQPKTAADKLRFIANKQQEAYQGNSFIAEYRCNKESWTVVKTILPIPEEELPGFRDVFQGLSGRNQQFTYDALRHNIGAKKLYELLSIKRASRRL